MRKKDNRGKREGDEFVERLNVGTENLVETVKALFSDPSVTAVTVFNRDGKQVARIPRGASVVAALSAVVVAPLAALAVLTGGALAQYTLEVERDGDQGNAEKTDADKDDERRDDEDFEEEFQD